MRWLTAILFFIGIACHADEGRRGVYEPIQTPIGRLGYRLGSIITVEGYRDEKAKGSKYLLVDTIDGEKLKTPIPIWVESGEGLPSATRIILKGFETGKWIGTPDEFTAAYPEKGSDQMGWQFFHFFIVTTAIAPETSKPGKASSPTL